MTERLRDIAVNIWLFIAARVKEHMKDEVEATMRDVPDFARSIALRLAPLYSKVLMEGVCRCSKDKFVGGEHQFEALCLNCRRPAEEAVKLFIRPRVTIEPFCWAETSRTASGTDIRVRACAKLL